MYSAWDITVREVGGGIWCLTSLALTIALLWYGLQQVVVYRAYTPTTLTAFAFTEFCAGSAMRGFLTWRQFMAAGNGGDPTPWIATWPWLGTSVLLNIVGAASCVWLLTPNGWRLPVTATTVVAAVGIPLLVFFFF